MPFIFSFRIKFKVCFIFFARYGCKKNSGLYINPSYFVFIKVSFFKRNPTISILLILSFLPFPIYNVTYSGKEGLGGDFG